MTEIQLEKIKILSRLKFAEKKIRSLAALKERDIQRAESFLKGFPDKEDQAGMKECILQTERLKKISADNYNEALKEYNLIYEDTMRLINDIPDQQLAETLRLRYIDDLTWEEIAVRTYYSLRNVKYMHKKALDMIKI